MEEESKQRPIKVAIVGHHLELNTTLSIMEFIKAQKDKKSVLIEVEVSPVLLETSIEHLKRIAELNGVKLVLDGLPQIPDRAKELAKEIDDLMPKLMRYEPNAPEKHSNELITHPHKPNFFNEQDRLRKRHSKRFGK